MSRFMLFIKHPENFEFSDIPQALFGAMDVFIQEHQKSGVLVDTAGFKKTREAQRVTLHGGKLKVVDGPFTETKEVVGGYAICECRDRQHALEVAKAFMELHRVNWPAFEGSCEVRPFETGA